MATDHETGDASGAGAETGAGVGAASVAAGAGRCHVHGSHHAILERINIGCFLYCDHDWFATRNVIWTRVRHIFGNDSTILSLKIHRHLVGLHFAQSISCNK
eukprot:scaffold36223_cov62-Attheya_sp.AAC.3